MNLRLKFRDLFKKPQFSVGLDIGTATIKSVKLKFFQDSVELSDFHLASAQPDLAGALKEFSSYQNVRCINTSVCGQAAVIRYVTFPKMAQEELRKALKFEAQKYIPFPLSEVNSDCTILEHNLADNKMLVAVVAVKKDFIEKRLKILQENNFKIYNLDMDSLALINAFNFNYPQNEAGLPKSIALLNIGATFSNLNILEVGMPFLSRDINIAGNNFTQKIAESFSLDFPTAERLKINPDKEKLIKINQAIESILTNLTNEVRVSFDFYESQSTFSVAKIYLSGAGSLLLGLKDNLANLLGIEIEYWDPFKKINIPKNIDSEKLKLLSNQLVVAVGLALRR